MNRSIPSPLIAVVAEIFSSHYTHAQLDNLFLYANAPGVPPEDTKSNKITKWLFRCNNDLEVDALGVLGKLIENYMEVELPEETPDPWGQAANLFGGMLTSPYQLQRGNRDRIVKALGRHGLSYYSGGIIRQSGASGPTKSLEGMLRSKDLIGVETEFARAIGNIESDPPASLTAACAIIESLCKFYIEDAGLEMPKDQTVKPLWNTVRVHLGMTPETIADQDLLKIITGLSSIVDGLGAFRSHVGSAHGHGFERYDLKPRHVRLAVHAAHTLTTFILETWDEQGKKAAKPK